MQTHTRAHRPLPSRRPGHVSSAPQAPRRGLGRLSAPTHTPRGRTPAPGGRGAHEPLAGPRSGGEGAALGSDGQSGRPIEPGTASPKGGSGGSDGPNERGARVGLPPGIPLAIIAGPWVTRKWGGRWRRQRLGGPVSDPGPPFPKPGQRRAPHPRGRARRRRLEPGSLCWGAHPLLSVATKSRGAVGTAARGRGAAGRDSERRRAKKWGEEEKGRRRLGSGAEPARSEVCGGPPPGPRHARTASLAEVRRRPPGRRRWLRAPTRAGAERAPLPLRPRFCVSLLRMPRPATACGGRC